MRERQTDRQTDRWTDRQTDRERGRVAYVNYNFAIAKIRGTGLRVCCSHAIKAIRLIPLSYVRKCTYEIVWMHKLTDTCSSLLLLFMFVITLFISLLNPR